MNSSRIRNIFSTFQNLNLLVLINNLEEHRVISLGWYSPFREGMCPLNHGLKGFLHRREGTCARACQLGIHLIDAADFISWWDDTVMSIGSQSSLNSRGDELLSILKEIYEERLNDADAVQAICETPATADTLS